MTLILSSESILFFGLYYKLRKDEIMRILHTSDWHLGKMLEGNSRIQEQKEFCQELIEIVERENIDIVIIAGDIYDNSNPPAAAESLFYNTVNELTESKQRLVIIISGNHDNPDRLTAAMNLAYEHGIILLGTPTSVARIGDYGFYSIVRSQEAFFELSFKDEKIAVIAMPYPSEKRLNQLIGEQIDEEENQKQYSEKIGDIFRTLQDNFKDDTINLAVGHFYISGGGESSSERQIQLGGAFAVNTCDLPKNAQYIAMGHLHRPQTVPGMEKKCYYSGSILQYSKDEINYAKAVNIVEVYPSKEPNIKKVFLRNYKPIEIWNAESIEHALELCEMHKDENTWVYINIKTDRVLELHEIKQLKSTKDDIVEIIPIFPNDEKHIKDEEPSEKSIEQLFKEFFVSRKGIEPKMEVKDMFLSILNEGEEEI